MLTTVAIACVMQAPVCQDSPTHFIYTQHWSDITDLNQYQQPTGEGSISHEPSSPHHPITLYKYLEHIHARTSHTQGSTRCIVCKFHKHTLRTQNNCSNRLAHIDTEFNIRCLGINCSLHRSKLAFGAVRIWIWQVFRVQSPDYELRDRAEAWTLILCRHHTVFNETMRKVGEPYWSKGAILGSHLLPGSVSLYFPTSSDLIWKQLFIPLLCRRSLEFFSSLLFNPVKHFGKWLIQSTLFRRN